MDDLKSFIREVPDFPKPGINFYDITTLLKDPQALRMTVDRFAWMFTKADRNERIDKIVGIEARGYMFAPSLAYSLNAGFVPVRKPGKLPAKTVSASYDLEYGKDRLEMHADAISPGDNVLIVDDVVATWGHCPIGGWQVETGTVVPGHGLHVEVRSGSAMASVRAPEPHPDVPDTGLDCVTVITDDGLWAYAAAVAAVRRGVAALRWLGENDLAGRVTYRHGSVRTTDAWVHLPPHDHVA